MSPDKVLLNENGVDELVGVGSDQLVEEIMTLQRMTLEEDSENSDDGDSEVSMSVSPSAPSSCSTEVIDQTDLDESLQSHHEQQEEVVDTPTNMNSNSQYRPMEVPELPPTGSYNGNQSFDVPKYTNFNRPVQSVHPVLIQHQTGVGATYHHQTALQPHQFVPQRFISAPAGIYAGNPQAQQVPMPIMLTQGQVPGNYLVSDSGIRMQQFSGGIPMHLLQNPYIETRQPVSHMEGAPMYYIVQAPTTAAPLHHQVPQFMQQQQQQPAPVPMNQFGGQQLFYPGNIQPPPQYQEQQFPSFDPSVRMESYGLSQQSQSLYESFDSSPNSVSSGHDTFYSMPCSNGSTSDESLLPRNDCDSFMSLNPDEANENFPISWTQHPTPLFEPPVAPATYFNVPEGFENPEGPASFTASSTDESYFESSDTSSSSGAETNGPSSSSSCESTSVSQLSETVEIPSGLCEVPAQKSKVIGKGKKIAGQQTSTSSSFKYLMDCGTTFFMNGEELPYVINTWEANLSIKVNTRPPNYEYYVPPTMSDGDYFGGQVAMWQMKMMQYFGKCRPDIWKLQGVPDVFRSPSDSWMHFNITTKLRFCCRNCQTPWTSKKGKLVFVFKMDTNRRGFIFLKLYGQICMRKECPDWGFQTPACYPEEIDRAMHKLYDYTAYIFYGIPLDPFIFSDCDKSIRVGNPSSRHRKELCQACKQGLCQIK